MVLALATACREGLQFLEILCVDVGFDRLRRIAHLQGIADISGVEPRLPLIIDLDAHSVRFELEGNDCAHGRYSESKERVKVGLPASTVRASSNCCCRAGGQLV